VLQHSSSNRGDMTGLMELVLLPLTSILPKDKQKEEVNEAGKKI